MAYWVFPQIKGSGYPTLKRQTQLQQVHNTDLLGGGSCWYKTHADHVLSAEGKRVRGECEFPVNIPVKVTIDMVKRRALAGLKPGVADKIVSTPQSVKKELSGKPPVPRCSPSTCSTRSGRSVPPLALSASSWLDDADDDNLSVRSTASSSGLRRARSIVPFQRPCDDQCPDTEELPPCAPENVKNPCRDDVDSDDEQQRQELQRNQERTDLWRSAVHGKYGNERWQCTRASNHARKSSKGRLAQSLEDWKLKSEKAEYLSQDEVFTRNVEEVLSIEEIVKECVNFYSGNMVSKYVPIHSHTP